MKNPWDDGKVEHEAVRKASQIYENPLEVWQNAKGASKAEIARQWLDFATPQAIFHTFWMLFRNLPLLVEFPDFSRRLQRNLMTGGGQKPIQILDDPGRVPGGAVKLLPCSLSMGADAESREPGARS